MISIHQKGPLIRLVMAVVIIGGFFIGREVFNGETEKLIFSIVWMGIGPVIALVIYAFTNNQNCIKCGKSIEIGISNYGFSKVPKCCPHCGEKT